MKSYIETITITEISNDGETLNGTALLRDGTTIAIDGEYCAIPADENGTAEWGNFDSEGHPTYYTREGSDWAIDVCLYDLPSITVQELRSANDQALTLWLTHHAY